MANKIQYEIIGRYMNGKDVTGYHLRSDNGKSQRYTREQVCFLVGRGQVVNCNGQIYKDMVLLRGVGVNIDSLPVVSDKDGSVSRTDNIGKVRKGVSATDAIAQLMIVGAIAKGRNVIGYRVRSAGGVEKRLSRQDVLKLAQEKRIGNARVQEYNGRMLLRGEGVNLNELPVEYVDENKKGGNATENGAIAGKAEKATNYKLEMYSKFKQVAEASGVKFLQEGCFDESKLQSHSCVVECNNIKVPISVDVAGSNVELHIYEYSDAREPSRRSYKFAKSDSPEAKCVSALKMHTAQLAILNGINAKVTELTKRGAKMWRNYYICLKNNRQKLTTDLEYNGVRVAASVVVGKIGEDLQVTLEEPTSGKAIASHSIGMSKAGFEQCVALIARELRM